VITKSFKRGSSLSQTRVSCFRYYDVMHIAMLFLNIAPGHSIKYRNINTIMYRRENGVKFN